MNIPKSLLSAVSVVSLVSLVFVATIASLAACVPEDAELGTVSAALGECDESSWGCSSNSPEVDHYGFHELNVYGAGGPNSPLAGFVTVNGRAKIYKGTKVYDLVVKDSRIRGYSAGRLALYGDALVGAEMRVKIGRAADYVIRIEGYRPLRLPYGTYATIEAYQLSWYSSVYEPNGKRNICKAPVVVTPPPSPTPDPELHPELLNMRSGETLVFEGDRFDSDNLTTSDAYDSSWVNFGCAGHTLAKMHLMRHTLSANATAHAITWQDRQATLKLLAADYCGIGRPFTEAGVPLTWQGDVVTYRSAPMVLEARWTENGATCLNVPRLAASQPDILSRIATVCGSVPPACPNAGSFGFEGALRVSALPEPQ